EDGIRDFHVTGVQTCALPISFVDYEKYYDKCLQSAADFIIINKEVAAPEGKTLFVCDDPFSAYVKIVKRFRPFEPAASMISDTRSEERRVGKECRSRWHHCLQ